MNQSALITVITLVPLVGAVVVICLGEEHKVAARRLAFVFSLVSLALVLLMWHLFDASSGKLQFEQKHNWISTLAVSYQSLAVDYHVGVDGLGLLMVLLSALVVPMAMLASWKIKEGVPIYFALVLFLQAGTMVGSVALLLAFLSIFLATGTFDFTELAQMGRNGTLAAALSQKLGWYSLNSRELALIIFGGAFLGFAVKVPLIPFHTWLPRAYSEAPAGTTMLLTGVMSKMGVYGFLRILLPIFPAQIHLVLTPLLWLCVITIVFSAGAAFAQRDLKRVLAYSSINHLGYCLLGLFAVCRSLDSVAATTTERSAALNGVLLQMFNHGLTAATLFWFVGFLEQRAGGLRGLNDFGGLRKIAPVFCGLMGIALFSSLGLPGLNGFIGEFLIFKGAFPLATWAAALSVLGLLITAIFILTILQRVFNGPLNEKWSKLPDLNLGERALVAVPIALMFLLGLWPQFVLGVVNNTAVQMVSNLGL